MHEHTSMKKILFAAILLAACFSTVRAEDAKQDSVTNIYWLKGITTDIGFSQLALSNWAAGGFGQISLNTYADAYANYTKDNLLWNNEFQIGYGFIWSQEDASRIKKSDDRLILDSKFGYKAVEKLYISTIFNMRSQLAKGLDYNTDTQVSGFFAPAYISLGVGIDYSPWKNVSINFAPLTGNTVIVSIPELRERYGNRLDQACRFELGAQMKIDAKLEVQNFKASTSVLLFTDYLSKPFSVKVNWDANVEARITKFFSVTLRTNLIYDDNVMFDKLDPATGEVIGRGPKVQFKELFSAGFSYTFGQAKKK